MIYAIDRPELRMFLFRPETLNRQFDIIINTQKCCH